MQDHKLYEYAILRVVPRVEREEFVNVGVIVYCSGAGFLDCQSHIDADRLTAFAPQLDLNEIGQYLHAFRLICRGDKQGGTIAALPAASRFRWLTATRSTVLQASKVHPGFCADPGKTLQHLFEQQVL